MVGKAYLPVGSSLSVSQGEISHRDIASRGLLRTGDLLEMIPGMVITQHSGSGKSNQMFLRGFNLDHGTDFATWFDGMPVNLRTHGHGQGYTDLNFIIPEVVEKIEFKKGAYFAEVGDFSGAGSAHFRTQNRLDRGLLSLTGGEDNFYRLLAADTFETPSGDWTLAFEQQGYDGPWVDIEEDARRTNLFVKRVVDWQGGHLALTLMGYDADWNSADQIPERAVDQDIITELGSIDTDLGGESSRYSLSLNWHNRDIDANLYAINYDLKLFSNFTYFLDDETNGDQFEQVDDRWIFGGSSVYTHDHRVIAGHDRNSRWWHPVKTRLGIDFRHDEIGDVGLFRTVERQRIATTRLDEVQQSSVGFMADSTWQVTPKFFAQLGARYDHYYFDINNQVDVADQVEGIDLSVNDGSDDDGIFSLKGTFRYQINDGLEAFFSTGQGFHSNDARGVTINVDPTDAGAEVTQVDPLVRSNGYELGFKQSFAERGTVSIAYWALRLDSELLFVGDAGNTEASDASEREGVEISVYYRPVRYVLLDAEYSKSSARFRGVSTSENSIPGAIDEVIQAGIALEDLRGWSASLRYRYFGPRPLEETNTVKADSSTILNFRAGYAADSWDITLDVFNLTDNNDRDIEYFYESRLANEPAGVGTEDVHYHVFEPRTARLTLRLFR